MTHEPHDTAAEAKAYSEDMKQQQEAERSERKEQARTNWAQRNGNSAGFDPYAELD